MKFQNCVTFIESELLDLALLRDYIGYARSYVNPILDEASSRCLIDKYLQMRKAGCGFGQVKSKKKIHFLMIRGRLILFRFNL